jgi:hypothetical protein
VTWLPSRLYPRPELRGFTLPRISLKPTVGKARPGNFVFSEQRKKYGSSDAHSGNRAGQSRRAFPQFGSWASDMLLAPRPVIGNILLERLQFTAQVVDPPLE